MACSGHLKEEPTDAPAFSVWQSEVRLKESEIAGVRDPKQRICYQTLAVELTGEGVANTP
jgi:hypothetical protein